ncbi:MAG: diguanylate cyclase [Microvirga sp.]|nr:diguanylate cyclase [Microvirga sp.]
MKVVVVDSSRVVAKAVSTMLEARGHHALAFADSREALEAVRRDDEIAAVITGLETWPIDGFELCWALRLIAAAGRPLHVIAMSSLANTRNLAEALDAGADDFISKPPVPEELHARLRAAERLTRMQAELVRQARTDLLSGLLNRRAFFTSVENWSAGEADEELGVVLVDLDRFKQLNDTHGHAVGDEAIRRSGSVLARHALSSKGFAARFGGEEFVLALPGRGCAAGATVAEALRAAIAAIRIPVRGEEVRLTASIGVTALRRGENVTCAIKRADEALYRAKSRGRDLVMIEDGPGPTARVA